MTQAEALRRLLDLPEVKDRRYIRELRAKMDRATLLRLLGRKTLPWE